MSVLAVAGAIAGIVGTAGGITSLVSYPALLAVGVPALRANVANIVAIVACWPGSGIASRTELAGKAGFVARFGVVTAVGGVIGATLLLETTSGTFEVIVPYLVAFSSTALIAQPRINAIRDRRGSATARAGGAGFIGGLLPVSVYNGYFGAGAGIMLLSLVLVTVDRDVASANALKNMLLGAATFASAVTFCLFTDVAWNAVAPLAIGMFVGSLVGPRVARRVPAGALRWTVGLIGIGLAVSLFVG